MGRSIWYHRHFLIGVPLFGFQSKGTGMTLPDNGTILVTEAVGSQQIDPVIKLNDDMVDR